MVEAKRLAAERGVKYIEDGMMVGLGTGSTVYYAILKLSERVKQGLRIKAIATSTRSEQLAKECGIKLVSFSDVEQIDITIDGADEVDSGWNLIKGGGGALLREKIVAAASKQLIIVVDESKVVPTLGKFPLPVEVVRFGHEMTARRIADLGCAPHLRLVEGTPYVTDNGNYIFDCDCQAIPNPPELDQALQSIPGVIDTGLFTNMASQVFVGYANGEVRSLTR